MGMTGICSTTTAAPQQLHVGLMLVTTDSKERAKLVRVERNKFNKACQTFFLFFFFFNHSII